MYVLICTDLALAMAVNRIEDRLGSRGVSNVRRVLPYFTAGFPDVATTAELVRRADAMGAAVVEIGFPYSDSIADGPVIQESFNYVLGRSHTLNDTFDLVAGVRGSVACGLIAMVSYSIVHRVGLDRFMQRAAAVGFDGVILPDVPVEEASPTALAAKSANLCHIGLVAPTTCDARREAIVRSSSGFIYRIAVSGTTGERSSLPDEVAQEVAQLKRTSDIPVCVGFGISRPEHVRAVCRVADGAIVGSALIRRIAEGVSAGAGPAAIIESVSTFLLSLMEAAEPADS